MDHLIRDEIVRYITEQIRIKSKINFNSDKSYTKHFFSYDIGFDAIDMVYLIDYLEARYNIKFSEEHFDSNSFYTVAGLEIATLKLLGSLE